MRSSLYFAAAAGAMFAAGSAHAADCPADGLRFGVEPYKSAQRLIPVYNDLAKLIADKVGCPVQLFVATSYNAEIEAMRNGKLEIGEFGPLGYVLAHQVAKAEAVAAFADKEGKPRQLLRQHRHLAGIGHQDAGGHQGQLLRLLRSGLHLGPPVPRLSACARTASIPTRASRAIYAGSHTASFEALRNHKVEAGELNSEQIASAKLPGVYKPGAFCHAVEVGPDPDRSDLPCATTAGRASSSG